MARDLPALILGADLARRITELSEDTAPERLPPERLTERLELTMRRRAERAFQEALAKRIWWRLTARERRLVGAAVAAQDPRWYKSASRATLEWSCRLAIERMIAERSHTSNPPEAKETSSKRGRAARFES